MKEIEILEKRGKREKHFLRKNGEIIAKMYSDDIHFMKNGIYEEIDNTLLDKNEFYINKNNDYKVYFPKNTKNYIMKFERDNNYIEFYLKNCNDTIITKLEDSNKLQSSIKYENVLKDITLEYLICPTKVKENIILKNKNCDLNNIKYFLKTNLELKLQDNKSVIAIKDEQAIFTLDVPYMFDSNNSINNNVLYNLVKVDTGYDLDIILDNNWLDNPNTLYPVTVDPTITNNNQGGNVYDTYIYPNDASIDRNSQDILKVGVERINGVDRINRALIKFDLPTIGTGSQIVSSYLHLIGYPILNGSYESDIVNVHQVTQDWTESLANWNTMSDKYNPKVECSFESLRSSMDSSGTISPKISGGDITRLVKKWYSNTPNNGILLKENNEVYRNDIIPAFFSKNNTVNGNNPKPFLTISYRNQNGLEKYMNYQTQGFSLGNTYFNTYNGNLVGVFNIGETIGGKLPVSLSLIYNTNDVVLNNNIGVGLGFRFNLNQTVKETTIEDTNYLEYVDEDGTIHYFLNDNGIYKDEDGLNLTIEKNTSEYVLKDKENNQMKFDIVNNIGYLTEIIDTSNNKITITYNDNKITKVTDANDKEINITYETNKITIDSPKETTTLNYSDSKLISIVSKLGTTLLNYNTNNIIDTITDINGKKIKYDYYEQIPYRIKKISEYSLNDTLGQYYDVSYGYDSTTIVDNKNRANIMTYNNYGNLVSASNLKNINDLKNAYGILQKYGTEFVTGEGTYTTYKNKLLSSGIPVKYVKNYLSDSSFEQGTLGFDRADFVEMSITDECANTGFKSLKMVNELPNRYVFYTLKVPKGNTYTFSAYFKNDTRIEMALYYNIRDVGTIHNITEIPINSEFTRYDVTIDYSQNASVDLCLTIHLLDEMSTVYIDDMQLEEGEVVNKYNMLENSDFANGLSDWTLEAHLMGTDTRVSTSDLFEVVSINDNNDKALKLKMNPANATSFSKTFNVKGKMGDEYNISFWYKDEGFFASGGLGDPICNNVVISYDYITDEGGHCLLPSVLFNPNDNDWQYFSTKFKAERDFKSITVNFYQQFNANDLYITNLYLYKDVRETIYNYDDNGNITSIFGLDKENSEFKYDKNNQLTKMINPRGKYFTYEYDNNITNRVLSGVSESGINNQIKYDNFGNPVLTRISSNIKEDLIDGLYQIRLKGTEKYLRNANKQVLINSDNHSHDLWKLEKIDSYYKISCSILENLYLNVNNNSLVLDNYNDTNSLFELIKQDNNSYLIKQKDNDKYLKENNSVLELSTLVQEDYHYQFYFEAVNKQFIESSAEYTNDGRFIKSVTDTNFNTISYDIDPNTGLTKSITNPKGNTINYNYDSKDRLTSIINGNKQINYTYNDNNLLSKISENNKEYNFIYDEFLNKKQIKIGDNITLVNNEYETNNGNLLKATYGNNHSISYTYDEFDRVKSVIKMNDTFNYKYDNNSDLVKIISNNDVIKYTYDLAKKLSEYRFNDFRIKYIYDKNDNVTNRSYSLNNTNHSIDHIFNSDDCITKTTFNTNEINYNYDYLGRLINRNINNIFNTNYEYVTNGNRTSLIVKSIANNNDKYSYKYDKLNNITHIYHNGLLENEYYYDEYNELIKENNYLTNETIKYNYDNYGNLLSKKVYDINNYNLINENKYEYNNTDWQDQLTKFNDEIITYDEIGNPLTIGNKTLTWINGRQLNTYNCSNNNISYKYDIDGIRTSKIVNGVETKYYLEGTSIILEKRNNDMIYYIRNDVDDLLGFKYNNTVYYYIKNIQDDIIGIIDSNNNIIANYKYDSWGNIISITDNNGNDISNNTNHIANINPFRYRSYYYDTETNLYYLNSRYYNPAWGRFINADGIIGANEDILGYNLYAYCGNNPIIQKDDSGKAAIALGLGFGTLGLIALGLAAQKAKKGLSSFFSSIASSLSGVKPYNPVSKPKTRSKTKTQTKSKEKSKTISYTSSVAATQAITLDTPIYRYGSSTANNLTPKVKDISTGLSFSTIPAVRSVVTTPKKINSTKVLIAVQDSPTHVTVMPVGATVQEWVEAGPNSIWTKAVQSVSVKWYGG